MTSSASFNSSLTTIREHFRRSSLLRSECSRESMQNDTWGSTKKDSRQVLQGNPLGNPFELIRPSESTLRKRNNFIQEDDLGNIKLRIEKYLSRSDEHKHKLRSLLTITQERKEKSYRSVTSPYKDDSPQVSSRTLRNPPVPEFVSVISQMREGSDRCLTSTCEDTTMLATSCWFKKRYTCIFMFITDHFFLWILSNLSHERHND